MGYTEVGRWCTCGHATRLTRLHSNSNSAVAMSRAPSRLNLMMHFVAPLLMLRPQVYIKIGVILPGLQVLRGRFFIFFVVLIIDY